MFQDANPMDEIEDSTEAVICPGPHSYIKQFACVRSAFQFLMAVQPIRGQSKSRSLFSSWSQPPGEGNYSPMILFDRKEQIMYPFVGSSCTKKTNTNSCGTCYKSSGGCGYLRVTKALLSRDAWVCIGYLQSKQLFRRTGRTLRFFLFFYDSLEILFHVTSISQETSIECDDWCSTSPSSPTRCIYRLQFLKEVSSSAQWKRGLLLSVETHQSVNEASQNLKKANSN